MGMNSIVSRLLNKIPQDQIDKVFDQAECDIDGEFIGFIAIYEKLSKIIPKHFTIIDLGCAYNPQCFYFTKHKAYIAVDESPCEKFQSENCAIYNMKIKKFIDLYVCDFNLNETFAICSYVPCSGDCNELIRQTFKNLFVYYPHNIQEQNDIFSGMMILHKGEQHEPHAT